MKLQSYLFLVLICLTGCEQQAKHDNNLLTRLAQQDDRYEQPKPENIISFPRAHNPHKNYRHEWWYLTVNLQTDSGQSLAAQWTLFRTAANQRHWYFAHGALADTKQHLTAFRDGREEFGNITIITKPFAAQIDDWAWQSSADLLPATLHFGDDKRGDESWQVQLSLISSVLNSRELNSSASNKKPPFFLHGDQGFSRKHPSLNVASHYYSQPFIDVSGRVLWQGKWQNVTGKAWFDREWGSQLLASDQQGWDWLSLRLDQDTALMVYRIRSNIEDYVYGSLMYRNGSSQTLSADEIEIITTAGEGDTYPSGFKLIIEREGVDIEIKIVNDQQINRFGIEYFEGMASFTGSHRGEGFVEMTGYR
jgi:predicted secreted hydrolase